MDCYIWAILEEGGWNWLKRCLIDRDNRTAYAYDIRRFPKRGDILVFYGNHRFYGRITVAEDGRQVTPKDRQNEPELGDWKNIMFLDGATLRLFFNQVQVESVADEIEKLNGKTGKSLLAACRNNPTISIDEYKRIVEKGYVNFFRELFLL